VSIASLGDEGKGKNVSVVSITAGEGKRKVSACGFSPQGRAAAVRREKKKRGLVMTLNGGKRKGGVIVAKPCQGKNWPMPPDGTTGKEAQHPVGEGKWSMNGKPGKKKKSPSSITKKKRG